MKGKSMGVKVIFEDDSILVLDKPAGLIVHSDGRTQEPSLADWILAHYPALASVGKPWISPQGEKILLPGIVHRLDRTTSGVMLVAKTPEMYAELKQAFKERRVQKTHRAFVHGHMEEERGKIVAEIMRSSTPPKRWYARACEEGDARAAVTNWRLLKNFTDSATDEVVAYIEAQPVTGRTHQIRVHFASIGHPLIGDHVYNHSSILQKAGMIMDGGRGGEEREMVSLGFTRPALHAYSITLDLAGQPQTFIAPLPPDFSRHSAN